MNIYYFAYGTNVNKKIFLQKFKDAKLIKKYKLKNFKIVFHLYVVFAKNRDKLLNYCKKKGIEAKVHYPKPVHLQPAAKFLNYKKGDFPKAEKISNITLSLPVHEFITKKHIEKNIRTVPNFPILETLIVLVLVKTYSEPIITNISLIKIP